MNNIVHLLLTRFDVSMEGRAKVSSEWLMHRIRLFENFCLPSVIGQTTRRFQWLVFFDAENEPLTKLMILKARAFTPFVPILLRGVFSFDIARDHAHRYCDGAQTVITTRLDNDDALAPNYLQQVQDVSNDAEDVAINFPKGFVLDHSGLCESLQLSNPFLSVIEHGNMPKTVWCCNHREMATMFPIRQLEEAPSWLQVIHGRNISNRMQGARADTHLIYEHFPSIPRVDPSLLL